MESLGIITAVYSVIKMLLEKVSGTAKLSSLYLKKVVLAYLITRTLISAVLKNTESSHDSRNHTF